MTRRHSTKAPPSAADQVADIYETFAYVMKVLQERSDSWMGRSDGMTGPQNRTLLALADGPKSMGTLSRLMYVHPSTASGMIDRLEAKGLVERRRARDDRRRVEVVLTAAGRAYLRDAPRSLVQAALEHLRRLDPEELATLHRAMLRLQEIFADVLADVDADICGERTNR